MEWLCLLFLCKSWWIIQSSGREVGSEQGHPGALPWSWALSGRDPFGLVCSWKSLDLTWPCSPRTMLRGLGASNPGGDKQLCRGQPTPSKASTLYWEKEQCCQGKRRGRGPCEPAGPSPCLPMAMGFLLHPLETGSFLRLKPLCKQPLPMDSPLI